MQIDEIEKLLNEIIQKYCEEDINDDYSGKSLITDLELDSVSLMQLITDIEEVFDIDFGLNEDIITLLDNYDKLAGYLCEQLKTEK